VITPFVPAKELVFLFMESEENFETLERHITCVVYRSGQKLNINNSTQEYDFFLTRKSFLKLNDSSII
jgi:hypothetical protein